MSSDPKDKMKEFIESAIREGVSKVPSPSLSDYLVVLILFPFSLVGYLVGCVVAAIMIGFAIATTNLKEIAAKFMALWLRGSENG